MASHQAKYAKAAVARGLCGICFKPRQHYAWRCDSCMEKHRKRCRKLYGWTQRERSSAPGRKSIVPDVTPE